MLKIITTLTLILIGLVAKGQEVENRKVSEFSKVEVQDRIELIYTESNQLALDVDKQNSASLENVVTEVKGKTLKIYLLKNNAGNKNENLIKVYLSSKNLTVFRASLDAKIVVTNQINTLNSTIQLKSGASFSGTIKNQGKTKVMGGNKTIFNGKIETSVLKGYFTANAKANINGKAKKANFETKNNALCNAKNFTSSSFVIHAEGNSNILVHSDSKIAVNVADKAKVIYTGLPETIQLNEEAELLYKLKKNEAVSLNY